MACGCGGDWGSVSAEAAVVAVAAADCAVIVNADHVGSQDIPFRLVSLFQFHSSKPQRLRPQVRRHIRRFSMFPRIFSCTEHKKIEEKDCLKNGNIEHIIYMQKIED